MILTIPPFYNFEELLSVHASVLHAEIQPPELEPDLRSQKRNPQQFFNVTQRKLSIDKHIRCQVTQHASQMKPIAST